MRQILIRAGAVTIRARLLDTPTADSIWRMLPIKATARAWGKEIYFDAPVAAAVEPGARDVVEPGEIVFWPDGEAVAIGFGPTPLSRRGEIRLAGACNVFAVAIDSVSQLQAVHAGEEISVQAHEAAVHASVLSRPAGSVCEPMSQKSMLARRRAEA